MEQPDRGDAAFAGTSGSRETTQNLGPVSLRSLPGVLGEPLARGTVTVGDSRPAARSKASKRHPSTGNLSGKAFDRPSDRRRSYGPAGGPGPAPAGDSGSVADRRGEPAAPGPHESLLPGLAICVLRQRDTRDVALTRLPNCGSYLKNRRSTNAGDPKFTWPDREQERRMVTVLFQAGTRARYWCAAPNRSHCSQPRQSVGALCFAAGTCAGRGMAARAHTRETLHT